MKKVDFFRKEYPCFVYSGYAYKISGNNLEIFFDFVLRSSDKSERRRISSNIYFQPTIVIQNIDKARLKKIGDDILNNFVFHLGLMEIPSYWKATCSPEIVIEAGHLNKEQIRWWKEMLIKGMSQFYYENKIDWRKPNFLKIISSSPKLLRPYQKKLKSRYLVPFAGGRDSIVTLEALKKPALAKTSAGKQKKEIALFMVNPTKRIQKTARVSGIKKQIIVERKIDKRLLKLNKKGYLNGHTPFTAALSFLGVFCGVLFDYKNIVFSNEKSANEGNVKYLGRTINHQWAKSSEFETMFKKYCKKYLAKNINYFSFLRKYTGLEISKMLTKYPQYFPIFSSCNASMRIGAKQIRWCGKCPKCLFVYATSYPFLEKKQLLRIFGKDLFEDKKLLPLMKSLLGQGKHKPFECVGTKKESQLAFRLSLKKAKKSGKIPYLLAKI